MGLVPGGGTDCRARSDATFPSCRLQGYWISYQKTVTRRGLRYLLLLPLFRRLGSLRSIPLLFQLFDFVLEATVGFIFVEVGGYEVDGAEVHGITAGIVA